MTTFHIPKTVAELKAIADTYVIRNYPQQGMPVRIHACCRMILRGRNDVPIGYFGDHTGNIDVYFNEMHEEYAGLRAGQTCLVFGRYMIGINVNYIECTALTDTTLADLDFFYAAELVRRNNR